MSRRAYKHLQQQGSIEPPEEGLQIVKALGSRGSNLIEVEYPGGRPTLCLLPAKFHKKLWIKKGSYLYIEAVEDADSRITGQIVRVLFEDDVKQLKKMAGIWPPEFEQQEAKGGAAQVAEQLQGLELGQEGAGGGEELEGGGSGSEEGSSDDDGLPPLQRINNRRVVEYEVSESESEDD